MVAPTIGATTAGWRGDPGQRDLWAAERRARSATSAARRRRSPDRSSLVQVRPNSSVSLRAVVAVPRPGQAAAGQRAPRDDADALVDAQRQHLPLLLAVEQVVVVLHGDEPGPAVALGDVLRLGELPGPHRRGARGSAPCPPAPRRAAPPSSPRSASSGPTGGSGRGRRSRCRAGAGCGRSRSGSPCGTGRHRWALAHPAVHLGGDDDLVALGVSSASARPVISSLVPSEYTLAVSKKLMPASIAWRKNGAAGVLVERPRVRCRGRARRSSCTRGRSATRRDRWNRASRSASAHHVGPPGR